jgi:hypothetical protein
VDQKVNDFSFFPKVTDNCHQKAPPVAVNLLVLSREWMGMGEWNDDY